MYLIGESAETAFQTLKQALNQVLEMTTFRQVFILETHALGMGLGGIVTRKPSQTQL